MEVLIFGLLLAVIVGVGLVVAIEMMKGRQSNQDSAVHFKTEGLEDLQRNPRNTFCNKEGRTVTVSDDISKVNCVLCLEMFERLSKTLPFKYRLGKNIK